VVALLTDPDAWVALSTLMALEIILGIDNVVFISILVSRCTREQALRARQIGLSLAFVFRVVMLFSLTSLMKLTYSLFPIFRIGISWRDIILIGGGLFLIAKTTHEIHHEVEPRGEETSSASRIAAQSFATVVAQLILIDLVFSLDSIITAIGMVNQVEVMIDVHRLRASRSLHLRASDNQNAGADIPVADRRGARRGGFRLPYSARIHLLCNGLCRCRRGLQCAGAPQSWRRRTLRPHCRPFLWSPLSQGPLSEAVCIICRNFPRRQGRHTHGHSHPAGGRRVQFDDVKAAR
jgi:hypothetical protein